MKTYNALFRLPILSPTQDEVGKKIAYNEAGVTASVGSGKSITITAKEATAVPVTGLCSNISRLST